MSGSSSQDSSGGDGDSLQAFEALLPYLMDLKIGLPKPVANPDDMEPIRDPIPVADLKGEIAALPADHLLLTFRQYDVYYGSAEQVPRFLDEIARQREITFRAFQEGNGGSEDRDDFDATYLHLFVWDREGEALVGAYRLGRTDELLARSGKQGVYLHQFFDFDDEFFDGPPILEIGRSFVCPDYQKSHHSLYLLWCGISRYIMKHPQYREVYGLASISRLYDARAMAVIRDVLLEPRDDVRAGEPYAPDLGAPWQQYLEETRPITMRDLSKMVKMLEDDNKDVPALIRHYHKLGATFHEAAVDTQFNNTPGLLLRLNVPSIPPKYMKMYFGDGWEDYVAFEG